VLKQSKNIQSKIKQQALKKELVGKACMPISKHSLDPEPKMHVVNMKAMEKQLHIPFKEIAVPAFLNVVDDVSIALRVHVRDARL
jgi:hypothetical protein